MSEEKFYEAYFSDADIATFKRVKHGQMRLGTVVRETLAEMVSGGRVQKVGWEIVITPKGRWKVMMGENSENSTERIARENAGLAALHVGNEDELKRWFRLHRKNGNKSVVDFRSRVRRKLS